jgi:uncharacterized protein YecT (DUF1311 family)
MTEPTVFLVLASAALAAVAIVTTALLAAWRGWLQLRRAELERLSASIGPAQPAAGTRIEIADLKERIRKLEAIAAGVEL